MSEFTDLNKLPTKKKEDDGSDDDGSGDESVGIEKMVEDDASSDGDNMTGEVDYESDDDDDVNDDASNLDGAYDDDVGEPGFATNIDDDASVSTTGSEETDESDGDGYFQKFDSQIRDNIINEYHMESVQANYDEVNVLCEIVKNSNDIIIDPFHKTYPILSKFEKTRVLGLRAKQINEGAKPFVEVNQENYDGYIIASKELVEKKIPFIIRRPMPNGASEYWRLRDLEVLG